MPRKNPVLLRPAPMSDTIQALTSYTRVKREGGEYINARTDGKHDVTADFDAIVCEALLDNAPDIALILDAIAQGYRPDTLEEDVPDYKAQVKNFREALVHIIERHNQKGHGS